MNSEERFAGLLQTAFDKRNGNRIRHLVRIVAHAYSQNPEELENYFNNENQLVAGIATSAYHFLTDKITPIQTKAFGGLGAIINQSDKNLKFNKKQLWFAKISGDSLNCSENSEDSLWYSKNSEDSLGYSKNSEDSLWYSKNDGDALRYSKNSSFSLLGSGNSDYSLLGSDNSDYSLWYSKNSNFSLKYSKNNGSSLGGSTNSKNSLKYAENSQQLKDSEMIIFHP